MRVRYGKSIKVTSITGDYFSSGAVTYNCSKIVENGIATLTKTDGSYAVLYKDVTSVSGHTYFYYCKMRVLDAVGSTDKLYLKVNTITAYSQTVTNPATDTWYEFCGKSTVTIDSIRIEPRCYCANGLKYQLMTPIVIDLTAIGLDNLTAQQFYNKYNQYFALIASGEEITIDNKAGQVSFSKLPPQYQQVEYIQSSGTQYINTDVSLYDVEDHKIILDIAPTEFYNYNIIWGSTYDADTFEGWVHVDGLLAMRYNYIRYGSDNTIEVNNRYLIEAGKSNINLSNSIYKKVNGTSYGSNTVNTKITDAKFLLFLSGSDYGKHKLYSCKLYKSGILVRNFIPCYRKVDNEIGLYDLVNKVFYSNAGTGVFLKGDNVVNIIPCKITNNNNNSL